MPILKQSTSAPKRPGNKFFATAIIIGLIVMAVIGWNEIRSRPKSKPAPPTASAPQKTAVPLTPSVAIKKTNAPTKPVQVLVVTSAQQIVVAPVPEKTNAPISKPLIAREIITPLPEPGFSARPVQNILEAQVALARRGISSGSIDGVIGSQTRGALRAFQRAENLPVSGELDAATKLKLLLTAPVYTNYVVTTNDLARLQPVGTSWLSKSRQTRLDYETILELASEKSCAHPAFLKRLNGSVNWTNFTANTTLQILNIGKIKATSSAAVIRIHLAEKILEAFDANSNLLAHFPCSIAQRVEKRPIGELRISAIAPDPDYTFAPENFPESAEARELKSKLILPPGPNNPVGTVWIGLDKPGYGIHGTPKPEEVGRTESHGCFRLANWNAEYLLQLITIGTPVIVEP